MTRAPRPVRAAASRRGLARDPVRLGLLVGGALAAILQFAGGRAVQASPFQLQQTHVQPLGTIPLPALRPPVAAPALRVDPGVAERLRSRPAAADAQAAPRAAVPAPRRVGAALAPVLPPRRPADLAGPLQGAAVREAAAARGAVAGAAIEASDLGGLGDPLGPRERGRGAGPSEPAGLGRLGAARGGGLDVEGLLAGPPRGERPASTHPSLVPDLGALPTGGLAGSTTTDAGGGRVTKEVGADGGVVVTKTAPLAGGGMVTDVVRTGPDGAPLGAGTTIETPSTTRILTVGPDGSRVVVQYDTRTGRMHEGYPVGTPGRGTRLDRTITGEEGGGGSAWVAPSGWGARGPLDARALRDGSARVRPAEPGGHGATAPALAFDRAGLVVNPDPETHARGGGGGPTARGLDGGRIVDPGPTGAP